MNIVSIIIAVIVSLIGGFVLGTLWGRLSIYLKEKKEMKNALLLLDNKYKNEANLDGQIIKTEKFQMLDDNDELVRIDVREPTKITKVVKELEVVENEK